MAGVVSLERSGPHHVWQLGHLTKSKKKREAPRGARGLIEVLYSAGAKEILKFQIGCLLEESWSATALGR